MAKPGTLPQRLLLDWGIRNDAKAAALKRLEQAGVIKVERPKGYMLKVKLTYGHGLSPEQVRNDSGEPWRPKRGAGDPRKSVYFLTKKACLPSA